MRVSITTAIQEQIKRAASAIRHQSREKQWAAGSVLYKRSASIFWPQSRAKASSRGTDKHELASEEDRVAV
jgi:hypothetical protein